MPCTGMDDDNEECEEEGEEEDEDEEYDGAGNDRDGFDGGSGGSCVRLCVRFGESLCDVAREGASACRGMCVYISVQYTDAKKKNRKN